MSYKNYLNLMIKQLKLKGCTEGTIKAYVACVKKVLNHLNTPVEQITSEDISEYFYQMISENLANSTINQNHSILVFFFAHTLNKPEVIRSLPYMKRYKKLPEILSFEELESIFRTAPNLRYKAIFMLMYSSGLRIGEVIRLKVSDIDSKQMKLLVRQGKGNKDRYTVLSERTLCCLRDYYRAYGPDEWLFFPYRNKSKYIARATVQKIFKSTVTAVGINKKVTPHSLRHAFACHLLENDTNIYAIKTLLGHSSLQSTQVYLQLSPAHVFSTKSPLDLGTRR